ncbi:hypothetical protein AB0G64_34940 [Streptomyces longwoodensis]|uniref:hypothetical protein n=1 Tax=Streptomyces longwoodensis TaxID=68231 RepID=UPI0033CE386C
MKSGGLLAKQRRPLEVAALTGRPAAGTAAGRDLGRPNTWRGAVPTFVTTARQA